MAGNLIDFLRNRRNGLRRGEDDSDSDSLSDQDDDDEGDGNNSDWSDSGSQYSWVTTSSVSGRSSRSRH